MVTSGTPEGHGRPEDPPAAASADVLLERLFVALEAPLTNALYRVLWDREAVRDVIQEAFVRLWRMRAEVDWDRAEPLAYRIALNLAFNRRRGQRLWRLISLQSLDDWTEPATEGGPGEALGRDEEARAVRGAVNALPDKYRRVLVLTEFAGLKHAQVAEVLDIREATVASRKHVAMKKLRAKMERWERSA